MLEPNLETQDTESTHALPSSHGTEITDPVCGMNVTPKSAKGNSEFGGQTYFLQSEMQNEVRSKSTAIFRADTYASSIRKRTGIYLPHASADQANGPMKLSNLRDDIGAGDSHRGTSSSLGGYK